MGRQRIRIAWGSGVLAGILAAATGGMATAPPDEPLRMSNLKVRDIVADIAGFTVTDSAGQHVGEVISVETDRRGLARRINVALDEGGEVELASFRAWLDARHETVALQLPEDIVQRRVEAADLRTLSTGT